MKKSEIFREVLTIVCDFAEVTEEEILSKCRKEDVVIARCLVVVYCKSFGLSSSTIQRFLSLKSHASISNYMNMYDICRKTDKHFRFLDTTIGHELDNIIRYSVISTCRMWNNSSTFAVWIEVYSYQSPKV